MNLTYLRVIKLSHEDSNLDKQNQNLSYYLYTIGQFSAGRKNKVFGNFIPFFFMAEL